MKGLIEKYNISEKELSKILTSTTEYACLKDAAGHWVDANEEIHHLFDVKQGDLIGKNDQELVTMLPQFKEIFEDCIVSDEETWKKKTVTEFEWEFYNKDGVYQIIKLYKIPLYHQDGTRKAILMLGQEITFSKLNELELNTTIKELADFKFALDESSIVATTDYMGKITYVNDKFCEISKYSRNELIGKDHRIINSGHHPKVFFQEMWNTKGFSNLKMGVNISSTLFKRDLVEMVIDILEKTELHPSHLELEITESSMQIPELTIPILNEMKKLGVSLSIDDFGTGYSSLAHLKDFPINSLKIDRSFVKEISVSGGAIIEMIITMASYLHVSVIAEGIETTYQLDYLKNLCCLEGQGYLFSRPIPAKEFEKLLFRQKRTLIEVI